jgi:hypothetical protein
MAGVVRSDIISEKKIDYNIFEEKIKNFPEISKNLLSQTKQLAEQGSAILLNRSITNDQITDFFKSDNIFFKEFSSLQNLHLNLESYAKIDDNSIIEIAENCPNLKKINLKSCLSISDAAVLALTRNCHQLEEIDLSWCDISEKSIFALAESLPKLKRVSVRSCYITDRSIEFLVKNCSQLIGLSLAWCKSITDKAVYSIADTLQYIEILDFRGNERITPYPFDQPPPCFSHVRYVRFVS